MCGNRSFGAVPKPRMGNCFFVLYFYYKTKYMMTKTELVVDAVVKCFLSWTFKPQHIVISLRKTAISRLMNGYVPDVIINKPSMSFSSRHNKIQKMLTLLYPWWWVLGLKTCRVFLWYIYMQDIIFYDYWIKLRIKVKRHDSQCNHKRDSRAVCRSGESLRL
jgi:hypothetical protein